MKVCTRNMRHVIRLERYVPADGGEPDEHGNVQGAWTLSSETFADVEQKAAREVTRNDKVTKVQPYTITIRHRDNIDTDYRVVLKNGTQLNIRSIRDPDLKRRWLILDCEEGMGT